MYKLGDQFVNKSIDSLVAQKTAIISGNSYRITVLTDRLLRLEYSSNGVFNNYETSSMLVRNYSTTHTNTQSKVNLIVNKSVNLNNNGRKFIISIFSRSNRNRRNMVNVI